MARLLQIQTCTRKRSDDLGSDPAFDPHGYSARKRILDREVENMLDRIDTTRSSARVL
jgi:hypothetical protein